MYAVIADQRPYRHEHETDNEYLKRARAWNNLCQWFEDNGIDKDLVVARQAVFVNEADNTAYVLLFEVEYDEEVPEIARSPRRKFEIDPRDDDDYRPVRNLVKVPITAHPNRDPKAQPRPYHFMDVIWGEEGE